MKKSIRYFNRKSRSCTYSIRAERRRERLLKSREKIGRPIETDSRRKNWSRYFQNYKNVSEALETDYHSNGGFIDKMEIHQDYLTRNNTTYPLRLVKRGLSDEVYSVVRKLPQFDAQARMELVMGEELSRNYHDIISVLSD